MSRISILSSWPYCIGVALILCSSLQADQKKIDLELVISIKEYIHHINEKTLPSVKRIVGKDNQSHTLEDNLRELRFDVEQTLSLILDMQHALSEAPNVKHEENYPQTDRELMIKMLRSYDESISRLTTANRKIEVQLQDELDVAQKLKNKLRRAKMNLETSEIKKKEITQTNLILNNNLETALTRLAQLEQDHKQVLTGYNHCRHSAQFQRYRNLEQIYQETMMRLTKTTNELNETAAAASNCVKEIKPADDRLGLALRQIERLERDLFRMRESATEAATSE